MKHLASTFLLALICLALFLPDRTAYADDKPAEQPASEDKSEEPKVTAQSIAQSVRDSQPELCSLLAKLHARVGSRHADAEFYARSNWHLRRAIYYEPDNSQARKKLGFERDAIGEWKLVSSPPTEDRWSENEKDPAIRTKVRTALGATQKLYRDELGALLPKLGKAATEAKAAGKEDVSRELFRLALLYNPDNEPALEARSYVKDPALDIWLPPSVVAAYNDGRELLERASEGEEVADQPADLKALEISAYTVKSGSMTLRTNVSLERAKHLMKVANASLSLSCRLTGMDMAKVFPQDHFTITVLRGQPAFRKFVAAYDTSSKDLKALHLQGASYYIPDRSGVVVCGLDDLKGVQRSALDARADDLLSNLIAEVVLIESRAQKASAPWVLSGFTYLVTARVLQTAHSKRYISENNRRTDTYRPDQKRVTRGNPFDPEELRVMAMEQIDFDIDKGLPQLANLNFNEIDGYATAKCFSFFEYLADKHPSAFKTWLSERPGRGVADVSQLEKATGKTAAELNQDWSLWVVRFN